MTNVEKVLEAMKARRAIQQAIKDEGSSPARSSALLLAKGEELSALRKLSGREAWLVNQTIAKEKK